MGVLQTEERGCVPIGLYLHKQMLGWVRLTGRSLPTSGLEGKAGTEQVMVSSLRLSLSLS